MSDTGAWMPWYVGDYLRDTAHLDTHEHGAYLLLLAHAWQHDGAIPLDHERLRRITKLSQDQWVRSESVILEFWQRNGTAYRQKRMDSELRRAKANYDQRVNAGKSRAYKRALSERSADVERTVSEPPSPSPLPSPSTPEAEAPAPAVFDGCGAVPVQPQKALSGKPDFKAQAIEILEYLNANTKRNYRPVDSNLKLIIARLKSGATPLQCREVVFAKCQQWQSDPKMCEYLRPATLFNATKFEQYLGEQHAMS